MNIQSRLLPAALLLVIPWASAALGAAVSEEASGSKAPAAPVAVFAELDGTWEGTFVGYDAEGREQYRIRVRQTYRTVDEHTQTVQIEDRMLRADGTAGEVIRGEGRNLARRLPDGSLELRCIVDKSNGDHVEHAGRTIRGPDGAVELIWYSETEGRQEVFREAIRREAEGWYYTIDGFGVYGGRPTLMAGRYRKVSEEPSK